MFMPTGKTRYPPTGSGQYGQLTCLVAVTQSPTESSFCLITIILATSRQWHISRSLVGFYYPVTIGPKYFKIFNSLGVAFNAFLNGALSVSYLSTIYALAIIVVLFCHAILYIYVFYIYRPAHFHALSCLIRDQHCAEAKHRPVIQA